MRSESAANWCTTRACEVKAELGEPSWSMVIGAVFLTDGSGTMFEFRKQISNLLSKLAAIDDHVDSTVIEQKFASLEALRQSLANCLLDDSRAGKSDERFRLGNIYVAQHGETGRDATGSRVSQYRNKRGAQFAEYGQCRRSLRHLQ